ncbi:MAG: gluconeogenesis factor YvcK family protein [Candidatus Obscuribacterales bacterium]|jgi:uncharacterized cofD-like protein
MPKKPKKSLDYRFQSWMLPGLKRYLGIVILAIIAIVFGVLTLLDVHPVDKMFRLIIWALKDIRAVVAEVASVMHKQLNAIILITAGSVAVFVSIVRITQLVLGAYLPERESIPDMLYRARKFGRGPKVVVIGGGTGLSNLLRGLKKHTYNITAIVTVGDDGGSSGRLREELGVLPPGDIRNCITALADEDKLVTELFRYRFDSGEGLEGHSFGNLFITAVCAVTHGDMIQAVRTASRVLNSCGQVLPSTLDSLTLMAEFEDGTIIRGESHISEDSQNKRIKRLFSEPAEPVAVPEAVAAIMEAELIVLGPGSLYTSVVPNLIVPGIADAVRNSRAKKIYVCNVMTQPGETTDYSVGDHVEVLLSHSKTPPGAAGRLMQGVLVNDYGKAAPVLPSGSKPVRFDPERLKELGVMPFRKMLVSEEAASHHDPAKLAEVIMQFFSYKAKRKLVAPKPPNNNNNNSGPPSGVATVADAPLAKLGRKL